MRSKFVELGPISQSIMVDGFMYCPRANRTPFVGLMEI